MSTICYVNRAATGADDGSTWRNAYTDLQSALHDTTCREIWVAQGVYKPTSGTNETISFAIPLSVQVYGGFAGDETVRDPRDLIAHPTILSGDIDNDDANAGGSDVDTSFADIHGDNSYHVITIDGTPTSMTDGQTVIDGFTITGGFAKYSGFHSNGGGLNCNGLGNGRDDSGVNCSPMLRHLVFSGNSAIGDGGAVYDNALNLGSSSPTFNDVTFVGNSARNNGGAICNVADHGGSASPLLSQVRFIGNSAQLGGAVYDRAEDESPSPSLSRPIFTDVLFEQNVADTGGGFYNYALKGGTANPTFKSVTFSDNRANAGSPSPYGGALMTLSEGANSLAHVQIINSTFASNQATFGGAILHGTLSGGDAQMEAVNVTFSGNSAQVGGALYNAGDDRGDTIELTNVILWGDQAVADASSNEIKNISVTLGISTSIVQGGCPTDADSHCIGLLTDTPKLGSLDANGGFTPTMMPGAGGSAIDTGGDALCPPTDQRGVARPGGTHCDIGAVETASVMPPTADSFTIVTQRDTPVSAALKPGDSNPGGPFAFTFTITRRPTDGSMTLSGDTATYTPSPGFVGVDSFTYTVSDVNGTSAGAVVTVQVRAPLPVAQALSLTVPHDTSGTVSLAATDDNTGGPFTYSFAIAQPPQHGSVSLSASTATYTPASGYVGSDSFAYTATDVNGTSLPATATIQVQPAATIPPTAQPKVMTTAYNMPATVMFSASDSNPGGPYTFAFTIASAPAHGTLSLVEGTHVTYTPAHSYSGPDSFTYVVTDANGTSAPATVTITVLPGGGGPAPGSTAAIPTLSFWNLLGLVALLGTFAVRKI